MLTKSETDGCRKILDKLNVEDIKSLVDTVTSKRVAVSGKKEGIKAILTYTAKALELLKRQKIKKDVLFMYLNDVLRENNEIGFSIPRTKHELILEILKRWGTDVQDSELMEIDLDLNESEVGASSSQDSAIQNQGTTFTGTAESNHSSPEIKVNIQNIYNVTHVHNNAQTTPDASNSNDTDFTVLGEKFAQWFYENLNSFCPMLHKTPQDFGPHHFWDDCHLIIQTWTPEPAKEEICDPALISERLLQLPKSEQLLFNPNLTRDGIFVKSNIHGLVQVLVCGTIHRGNDCLGLFKQLFGIIKDPRYHDNWKIKMTKLYLTAMQALTSMPKLEGNPEQEILAMCSDLRVNTT